MLGSDMLTENPNCADSPLGAHKKIAYMYRGMNEAERAKFRQDQTAQVEKAIVSFLFIYFVSLNLIEITNLKYPECSSLKIISI